ncbi:mycofactocin-coupled SDR family oxidoreductase [Pseudonocardia endophytica]|uniref:SDR family mycofactocin-dependent oxidoreductase n=1 Tax=Pseudonocardia endophytica TaxID=401976 RepID=A0A4V2PHZ2_PSEEN|nr:mycofactocin-coupled SDR family oxidoreductase [Pseudonocardia endophytica]TCK22636.1 SDR family mycofactocin-dependent oxidoreductase [Pseudonocardia endophytica]
MGRVEGKVALVTGAARGQGRSHAVRLAQEGADIVALDICQGLKTVKYDGATDADLAETASMIEDLDRRVISRKADVRDLAAMESAVADAVSEFGRLDIVVANAGIATAAPAWELTEEMFQEMVDINLVGVWKTVKPAIPVMIEQGSGSIILTSSTAGLVAFGNLAHYTAAKHGVTGLMRTLAVELAQHNVRCNSVHPTTVDTPMIQNDVIRELFLGRTGATRDEAMNEFKGVNALPIPWVEAVDISNAVLYLASDEARYVTGHTQVVDAGGTAPYRNPNV